MIELLKKANIKLTQQEIENILIFGNIRGPYSLQNNDDNKDPDEFSDYEIMKEFWQG